MGELVTNGSKYTDEQRIDAAIMYAHKGTFTKTSQETGIPDRTLSDWAKSEWWDKAVASVRAHKNDYFIARYTELVEKGCDIALEKLPEASARDAMIIAATANDKLRLALNQPTSISGNSSTINNLVAQFNQLSQEQARISRDHDNIQASVVQDELSTDKG